MMADSRDFTLRQRFAFWALALAVGALSALDARFEIWGDSVSYIEMGQAYFRHDWKMAINSYWSPLYAWLITLPEFIFGVSLREESTAVHLVNLAIFGFVLFSLEYFLAGLIYKGSSPQEARETAAIEPWALRTIAYSLFMYSTLNWLSTDNVTPDLMVEGLVLLTAGVAIRIQAHGARWRLYAKLGLILGIGYLTKVVLFPLSFVFFGASVIGSAGPRRSILKMVFGILVFSLIAGPYIFTLSRAKGHFTYGDAGKLTYATYVNGLPLGVHWQASGGHNGSPIHPTRMVLSHPAVFEFAEPVGGSYPAWYDPTYWYDGAKPHFEIRPEIGKLRTHAYVFFDLLMSQGEFVMGLLALSLAATGFRSFARSWAGLACLWIPCLVALGAYALIHIETRFLPGFLIVLWMSVFAAFRFADSLNSKKVISCVSIALALTAGIRVVKSAVVESGHLLKHRENPYWEVAEELHELGVQRGDKVASIGFSFDGYWAHLAGVKIVAEVPEGDAGQFWLADPATKSKVLTTFASYGAKAVVCNRVPAFTWPPGWIRVGNSTFFVEKIPTAQ